MILNWETAELDPVTSGDEAIRREHATSFLLGHLEETRR